MADPAGTEHIRKPFVVGHLTLVIVADPDDVRELVPHRLLLPHIFHRPFVPRVPVNHVPHGVEEEETAEHRGAEREIDHGHVHDFERFRRPDHPHHRRHREQVVDELSRQDVPEPGHLGEHGVGARGRADRSPEAEDDEVLEVGSADAVAEEVAVVVLGVDAAAAVGAVVGHQGDVHVAALALFPRRPHGLELLVDDPGILRGGQGGEAVDVAGEVPGRGRDDGFVAQKLDPVEQNLGDDEHGGKAPRGRRQVQGERVVGEGGEQGHVEHWGQRVEQDNEGVAPRPGLSGNHAEVEGSEGGI